MCACRAGVNALLIDWFQKANGSPKLQGRILQLLQVTGAYSISGAQPADLGIPVVHDLNVQPQVIISTLLQYHLPCHIWCFHLQ